MATIICNKMALIEVPQPTAFQKYWPGVDWTKFSLNNLSFYLFDMVACTDAWIAIQKRWAAGDFAVR